MQGEGPQMLDTTIVPVRTASPSGMV